MQKIKQSKAKQGHLIGQQARALLSKSEDLDLIPSFHVVERENQLLKVAFTHIHTQTYMHISCISTHIHLNKNSDTEENH